MLSSAEVGTLITALGCGIGRDEFDPGKLRYDRIIIMTDADVDGSHIRTLLLTFFYRQMYTLVEEGHIYIAQPPLYKIKAGKQERYVKDDAALNNYLLQNALDGAELSLSEGAPAVRGEELERLAKTHLAAEQLIDRLSRRYEQAALTAMLYLPPIDSLEDPAKVQPWLDALTARLSAHDDQEHRYEVRIEREAQTYLEVVRHSHGIPHAYQWGEEFFVSPEYKQLMLHGETLRDLVGEGASISRGNRSQAIDSFKEALEWMMAEGKRGQHIQRYKGLGEMNPDQLWETTMDPEVRRLMQVRIEDVVASDEIFTTLMGDQVEPRRDFIERNALLVGNLDV